ncbi:hypothetical protein G7054_g14530 [Neopestalotiopsis clavispora]|nr:hypothetical protein G7054_g14530 [Neopestalotiopsis clavispora]
MSKSGKDKGKQPEGPGVPASPPPLILPCNHMDYLIKGFEALASARDQSRATALAGRPNIGTALGLEGFHRNSEAPRSNNVYESHNRMYNAQLSYNPEPVLFGRFLSWPPQNPDYHGSRDNPQIANRFLANWALRNPDVAIPSIEESPLRSSVASRMGTVEPVDISGRSRGMPVVEHVGTSSRVKASPARSGVVLSYTNEDFCKERSNIPPYPVTLRDIIDLWTKYTGNHDPRRDPVIDKAFQYLVISVCNGFAKDRYLRWEMINEEFWVVVRANTTVTNKLKDAKFREQSRIRPLFAEINNGSPYGRTMYQICRRPDRVTGLFIQMYSEENMVPCHGCETKISFS